MAFDKQKQKQQIEKFIKKMPSLSTTVGKVLEICSRIDASPNELNKVISLDPVLTGQLLKLINSAYYSLLNKITSLTRAITMLGMNTVKNMALSTAIIRSVSSTQKSKVLPTSQFWQHSIGVGVSAKLLAIACGVPVAEREEMFVAGLLHDLGKVPFGDEYIDVLNMARKEQRPLIDVERELMGIDHQEVGMMISEKWKLNTVINSCIGDHHEAGEAVEGCRQQVSLVALANMYINTHNIGYAGDPFPDVTDIEKLLAITGLGWPDYNAIGEDVEKEIEKAQVFLHV
jgi:putative nucleotidyltransferase with HDIG domain